MSSAWFESIMMGHERAKSSLARLRRHGAPSVGADRNRAVPETHFPASALLRASLIGIASRAEGAEAVDHLRIEFERDPVASDQPIWAGAHA